MSRYLKTTKQTMSIDVAGMHARIELTWTDADEALAWKTLGYLRSAITQPASESYAHIGPWDVTTVTTERSNSAAFDDLVITMELAGRNPDPMEGA
jgi:hypothetical protein